MDLSNFASHLHPNSAPHFEGMVFTKNAVKNPNIIVGDYTYHHSFDAEEALDFEKHWVCYPHPQHRLIIGKFCAIAHGVKFLLQASSHKIDGISTYPFASLMGGWEEKMPFTVFPKKGDTLIGNDVWIGAFAMIMPGVNIGDGAVIGAGALVAKDVEPYTIVGGNPAKLIRRRYDKKTVQILREIAWWDWDIQTIYENCPLIYGCDIEALKKITPR